MFFRSPAQHPGHLDSAKQAGTDLGHLSCYLASLTRARPPPSAPKICGAPSGIQSSPLAAVTAQPARRVVQYPDARVVRNEPGGHKPPDQREVHLLPPPRNGVPPTRVFIRAASTSNSFRAASRGLYAPKKHSLDARHGFVSRTRLTSRSRAVQLDTSLLTWPRSPQTDQSKTSTHLLH